MSGRHRRALAAVFLLAAVRVVPPAIAGPAAAPPAAGPVVLRGGTVHPVASPAVEDGFVLFEDGTITAVGPASAAPALVPAHARVVDVTGRHVWPGLIDALGFHGLTEIGSVRGTLDYDEAGGMNPNARVEVAIRQSSTHFPVTRSNGILLAAVIPQGGLVPGTACAIALEGWSTEEMVRRAPVGLVVQWPNVAPPEKEGEPSERDRAVAKLDAMIEEARAYAAARVDEDEVRAEDVRWESLDGVVAGEVPVWIRATTRAQILDALDWTDRHGLRTVLVSGDESWAGDAWTCAGDLAARGIPVICHTTRRPRRRDDPYDVAFTEPGVLRAAGVSIAFGSWTSAGARNLPQEAARAAAFGLDRDAALRAITLDAARLLGIDDRYGSLEPGKSATMIVTDQDVLEQRMRVERAWLDGRELDLDDSQKQLRRTWSSRPLPDGSPAPPLPPDGG